MFGFKDTTSKRVSPTILILHANVQFTNDFMALPLKTSKIGGTYMTVWQSYSLLEFGSTRNLHQHLVDVYASLRAAILLPNEVQPATSRPLIQSYSTNQNLTLASQVQSCSLSSEVGTRNPLLFSASTAKKPVLVHSSIGAFSDSVQGQSSRNTNAFSNELGIVQEAGTSAANSLPASPLLKPVVIKPSAPPLKQKGIVFSKKQQP